MNLSKLFVIALLAGTLGVFGCSEDDNGGTGGTGTGGTGGTGGSTTDPCTGPLCDAPEPKAFCVAIIEECNDTVEVDLTPAECDVLGNAAACQEGSTGGTGGTGGAGGGGADVGCNVLGCMTDPALKAKCEAAWDACLIYCAAEEDCQEDECAALGLLICNLT
jgi:hypothetical protein